MTRRPIIVAFAALLTLTGCAGPFEPAEEWVEFDPPAQYRAWHGEVETCVGVQRSFDDIIWRKVLHAETFPCADDLERAAGCFVHPRTIYLVEWLLGEEYLIKSELIHYVRHDIAHDAAFWRCGGGP